jgi:Domain of unknown function (DUF4394)
MPCHKKYHSLINANAFSTTPNNCLIAFNTSRPHKVIATFRIRGLQPGEVILGIDFRPANGSLYALGSTSRIYIIAIPLDNQSKHVTTTQVGAGPITPLISGTAFGFDFNPVADRIRIVSNTGQNLRVNPDTLVTIVDTSIVAPNSIVGAAYTNSVPGAATTTLYVLNSFNNTLAIQNPPNLGVITPVGPLNVSINGSTGFDIVAPNNDAFAVIHDHLYSINLMTGNATIVGRIGSKCQYQLITLAIRHLLLA